MLNLFSKSTLLLTLISTSFSVSLAWMDMGHQVIAEIAERNLTPEAKQWVQSILGPEPLAIASIWPDQVRVDPRYKEFASYHYLTFPSDKKFSALTKEERPERDADTIIIKSPEILKSTKLSVHQKMILLRFLVHVIGDVHQPLHVGNSFDRGGNLCDVMWKEANTKGKPKKLSLHSFWDDNMIKEVIKELHLTSTSKPNSKLNEKTKSEPNTKPKQNQKFVSQKDSSHFFSYRDFADSILTENQKIKDQFQKIQSQKPMEWYEESYGLHSQVYPDGDSIKDPQKRAYCKQVNTKKSTLENGNYDTNKIPRLDEQYIKKNVDIIKTQLLKAGLRLAYVLNSLAKEAPLTTTLSEEKFFEEISLNNK